MFFRRNSINRIEPKTLSLCNRFENLDLSENLLTNFENETFIGLQNLNRSI
jgi:hypothetical protein